MIQDHRLFCKKPKGRKRKKKRKKKANAQKLDDNPLTGESSEDVEEQETPVLLDAFRFSPCLYVLSEKIRKLKKGYFCHKFNIPQNQLYVGPYPAKDYYMPEVMSVKGRNKSEEGHVAQQGKILIFKNFKLSACQTFNC